MESSPACDVRKSRTIQTVIRRSQNFCIFEAPHLVVPLPRFNSVQNSPASLIQKGATLRNLSGLRSVQETCKVQELHLIGVEFYV